MKFHYDKFRLNLIIRFSLIYVHPYFLVLYFQPRNFNQCLSTPLTQVSCDPSIPCMTQICTFQFASFYFFIYIKNKTKFYVWWMDFF